MLIIGCGNLLRGDDGVGPIMVRHLWERGMPDGVRLVDGGTAGMDVAFQMRARSASSLSTRRPPVPSRARSTECLATSSSNCRRSRGCTPTRFAGTTPSRSRAGCWPTNAPPTSPYSSSRPVMSRSARNCPSRSLPPWKR
ncbi:hydrogenase maturation protease family protein [Mycobacterium xenopi 3993]|nr:hydrogenase maturation protease family protein [Mycobacterium xenopi 3993]